MDESFELEAVPGQLGTGIVRIADGSVQKCTGQITLDNLAQLHTIVKHSIRATAADPLRKMTIQTDDGNFVLTTDGQLCFVVLLPAKA